jgi:hypothetical protein
LPEHADEDHT